MADKKTSTRKTRATSRAATPTEGAIIENHPTDDAASVKSTTASIKERSRSSSRSSSPSIDAEVNSRKGKRKLKHTIRSSKRNAYAAGLASRSGNETASLAPSVEFNIVSQYSRLSFLQQSLERAQRFTADRISLIELDSEADQLENIWWLFNHQNESFAEICSEDFFKHRYMTEQVYAQGLSAYINTTSRYAKLKAQLIPTAGRKESLNSSASITNNSQSKTLPQIPMPEFTGNYADWPSFKDLFTSLIINDSSLSQVHRMHYLKGCVKDSAAKLISTLPVSADPFDAAWQALTGRYENKRLLISTHLDQLFQLKALSGKSATALQTLLSTITEALNALKVLGSPVEHWDQFLVYLVTQKIDSHTREAWENKLGSATEFPKFQQLKTFLVGRARALERLKASAVESSTSTPSRNVKSTSRHALNASAAPRGTQDWKKSPFPCDCCQEDHFIVYCPKFRELPPPTRRRLAQESRLCFNCLGHHSARACNSDKSCRTCGEKHHSMIHVNSKPNYSTSQKNSSSASNA